MFWYTDISSVSEVIQSRSILDRLAGAGQFSAFYLYKALCPFNLSFMYKRWTIDPSVLVDWLPTTLIVTFLTYLVIKRGRSSNWLLLFASYFLITLLPVLGFFQIAAMRFSWVADHYVYLSLAGLVVAIVTFGAELISKIQQRIVIVSLVCTIFISLTIARASVYVDERTIWSDTLKSSSDIYLAHLYLGILLFDKGKIDGAISEYNEALRIKPDFYQAYNYLGLAFEKKGQTDLAILHYAEALRIKKDYLDANNNLGNLLVNLGKATEAMEYLERALQRDPDSADVHNNLGMSFAAQGKFDKAVEQYKAALRNRFIFPDAENNLGVALASLGKRDEAIAHYMQALANEPNNWMANNNVAIEFAAEGNSQAAISHFESALRSNPSFTQAHANLAKEYLKLGRREDATREQELSGEIGLDLINVKRRSGE